MGILPLTHRHLLRRLSLSLADQCIRQRELLLTASSASPADRTRSGFVEPLAHAVFVRALCFKANGAAVDALVAMDEVESYYSG